MNPKTKQAISTLSGTKYPPLTYNGYRFLCFFKQEAVYGPIGNPMRFNSPRLCFLRGPGFVRLTPEDLHALEHSFLPYCFPKLQAALAAELEAVI